MRMQPEDIEAWVNYLFYNKYNSKTMSTPNTIEITRDRALTAYKKADSDKKAFLEDLLGKDNLIGDICQLVKTFEDACAILNLDTSKVLYHTLPANAEQVWENNEKRARIITKALNGPDWQADYSNAKQEKWRVWFVWDASAGRFRFYDSDDDDTLADAGTGARRVFKSRQLAEYYGRQFVDLENELLAK